MTDAYQTTLRNRVRQLRDNARYDKASVHRVLDAGLVAQVGFVQEGQPVVIPMIYGRVDDTLYLHGARKARIVKLLTSGAPVCVNVTLVDGIVYARSAFNSSMNYRSVVVFGTPRLLEDAAESLNALRTISEHTMPGRWDELRVPHERELKQTGVIELSIESASAKVAEGPPEDEEEDYGTPVWAGVVSVETRLGAAVPDDRLIEGVEMSPAAARQTGRWL